ncbi:hypothetical protein ACFL6W_10465 [Thermodesulfobacteriota bacterium]
MEHGTPAQPVDFSLLFSNFCPLPATLTCHAIAESDGGSSLERRRVFCSLDGNPKDIALKKD